MAVLERLEEPDLTVKAGAINIPTAEAFYRRGLLPVLTEAQQAALSRFGGGGPPAGAPRFVGHFGAIWLTSDLLDESDVDLNGHGAAGTVALIAQQQIEAILGKHAEELGVHVRRGAELTGFEEDDAGITVHAGETHLRTGWLVGCDGGRSLVRKLAGFEFRGTGPEITGHQAMAVMTGRENLKMGWNSTPTGIYAHGPMPERILTVEFDGPPADRDAEITKEELEKSILAVSGVDVKVTEIKSATRFTDNARQATTYRIGRVLLAGDAAHVHSPFGGQGLNLGIGDAVNLGWKLAATIQGWAPSGLLDSYTTERHPIGAWVLDWTRAQIAIMRPDPHAQALRAIVMDLAATTTGTTYFAKKISGVWQHYDLPGDHPLIGRTVPDLTLADDTHPADLMHSGSGLLLDFGGLPSHVDVPADRVRTVQTTCTEDLPGLLIRPDGVVVWAGGDGLDEALATWFGC